MIKINNLRLYWKHVNNNAEDRKNFLQSKKDKTQPKASTSYTECSLVNENTGAIISKKAFCYSGDNFSKDIGRKLYFEKVMREVPKDVRVAFWEALKQYSPKTLKTK